MNDNILDIDPDTPVWRVFRPEYFLGDVKNRTATLIHVSKWEDPFENFLEKCQFVYQGIPVNTDSVLGWFFGQCWTDREQETDATWRIYSCKSSGVRVRSTVGSLLSAVWDADDARAALKYFIGSVRYFSEQQIHSAMSSGQTATWLGFGYGGSEQVRTLLFKRLEFEHEREVRLIFRDTDHQFRGQGLVSRPLEPNARLLRGRFRSADERIGVSPGRA